MFYLRVHVVAYHEHLQGLGRGAANSPEPELHDGTSLRYGRYATQRRLTHPLENEYEEEYQQRIGLKEKVSRISLKLTEAVRSELKTNQKYFQPPRLKRI